MSLTTELSNPNSPISKWFSRNANAKMLDYQIRQMNFILGQNLDKSLCNFDASPAIVGTAFDYAFRWHVAPLNTTSLIAYHATRLDRTSHWKGFGSAIVQRLVDCGNKHPEERAFASVILAHYERIFRSDAIAPFLEIDAPKHWGDDYVDNQIEKVKEALNPNDVSDVENLTSTIDDVWGDKLKQAFKPNPVFYYSSDIGGADGDWILGSTLYDCKCSWKRKPATDEMLKQVVGYRLLMGKHTEGVDSLGFYFPRHRTIFEWRVDELIGDLDEKIKSFENEVIPKQTKTRIGKASDWLFDDEFDFIEDILDFDF